MKTARQNRTALAVFVSSIVLATITMPGQSDTHPAAAVPRINMDEVPLDDAIKILAQQSDLNYIIDPRVISGASGRTLTFTWENISAKGARDRVLGEHGLVLIENAVTLMRSSLPSGSPISLVGARGCNFIESQTTSA